MRTRTGARFFEVHVRAEPALRIGSREAAAARFVGRQALLAVGNLPPFVRARLDGRSEPVRPASVRRA